MPIGAIAGASVIGAGASIISGNKASNAVKESAAQTDATNRYIYDTNRADFAPYREVGQGALYKLADMMGVPRTANPAPVQPGGLSAMYGGGATPTSPSAMTPGYEGFEASPGYQFRIDEAMKAIERSAAARGSLRSGATMDALQRRVQGVASDEYNTYVNRLASLAGIGQTATGSTAAAGQAYANQQSQTNMAAGNARASAYANTGNAINQGVQNLASAYLYGQGAGWFGGRPAGTVPGYGNA